MRPNLQELSEGGKERREGRLLGIRPSRAVLFPQWSLW